MIFITHKTSYNQNHRALLVKENTTLTLTPLPPKVRVFHLLFDFCFHSTSKSECTFAPNPFGNTSKFHQLQASHFNAYFNHSSCSTSTNWTLMACHKAGQSYSYCSNKSLSTTIVKIQKKLLKISATWKDFGFFSFMFIFPFDSESQTRTHNL